MAARTSVFEVVPEDVHAHSPSKFGIVIRDPLPYRAISDQESQKNKQIFFPSLAR